MGAVIALPLKFVQTVFVPPPSGPAVTMKMLSAWKSPAANCPSLVAFNHWNTQPLVVVLRFRNHPALGTLFVFEMMSSCAVPADNASNENRTMSVCPTSILN